MDSYGLFEKKWQFSADLIKRGFKILEISDDTQFLDGNIKRLFEEYPDKYMYFELMPMIDPNTLNKLSAKQHTKP